MFPPVVGTGNSGKDQQLFGIPAADGQELPAALGQCNRQGVDMASRGKGPGQPISSRSPGGQSPTDDASLAEQLPDGDDHGQGSLESIERGVGLFGRGGLSPAGLASIEHFQQLPFVGVGFVIGPPRLVGRDPGGLLERGPGRVPVSGHSSAVDRLAQFAQLQLIGIGPGGSRAGDAEWIGGRLELGFIPPGGQLSSHGQPDHQQQTDRQQVGGAAAASPSQFAQSGHRG